MELLKSRAQFWCFTLVVAGASLGTARAHADEPVPEPVVMHAESHPPPAAQGKLILFGGAVAVGWYAAVAVPSFVFADAPGVKSLRVPVAGPWLALADKTYTTCADSSTECSTAWTIVRAILTGIDGVGQASGLILMTEGAFMSTRSATGRSETKPSHVTARLELEPLPVIADRHGISFGLIGRF